MDESRNWEKRAPWSNIAFKGRISQLDPISLSL